MDLFGKKFLAAAALVATAASAGAQAAATAKPACDIGESSTGNAARATVLVNIARDGASSAVKVTNLKSSIKLLEHPDKGDNLVTDAYVLGMSLSLIANEPGIGLTPKRSAVGFVSNPEGTLDIPSTLDSLFKIVEAAKPICSDYTTYWRAGQKFYLDAVNGAIGALNADKLDSAELYAKQANVLYGGSPYGPMIIGSVAAKRNDYPRAIEYWTKAADIAAKDTSYRDVRRQMLANIGSQYMTAANGSGPDKVDAAKKAAAIYEQLIAVPGTRGTYLSGGRQQIQNAYMIAGDTAAAARTWQPLIADPSAYEYSDLLNSAVNAARASRSADAAKLFEAALAQNPNSRDALYNVAVTYLTMEQNDKVGPLVTRLVAVDPGNPENYNLAARAYLAMAKAAEKAKKGPLAAAYNDTTLTWYNTGNKLPAEVFFSEVSPGDKQMTISGTIGDRRDKADVNTEPTPAAAPAKPVKGKAAPKAPAKIEPKTYAPAPVTLTFVGLDKAGQVVSTETVKTTDLTPGKQAPFTVTLKGPNIVAYRYSFAN
jgi:hypothetical protein